MFSSMPIDYIINWTIESGAGAYNLHFYHILENWDQVLDEMCRSNILQRDNQKFARKLNKDLVKVAKERSDHVIIKFSKLTDI